MSSKKIIKGLLSAAIILTAWGCGSSQPMVSETVLLDYMKDANQANTENLSKNYGTVINKSRKTGVKECGIYSDYAVTLVKQGKRAEANSWFNREMEAFPSSRGYVMQLKRLLIPEYQDNNSTSAATLPDAEESDKLSPAKRKAAEKRAAEAVGDQMEDTAEPMATEPIRAPEPVAEPKP